MGRWVTLEVQLQSRTGIIGFSTVPKNFLPSLCARRVELILIGGGIQIGRGGIEIRCGRNGLEGWRLVGGGKLGEGELKLAAGAIGWRRKIG